MIKLCIFHFGIFARPCSGTDTFHSNLLCSENGFGEICFNKEEQENYYCLLILKNTTLLLNFATTNIEGRIVIHWRTWGPSWALQVIRQRRYSDPLWQEQPFSSVPTCIVAKSF